MERPDPSHCQSQIRLHKPETMDGRESDLARIQMINRTFEVHPAALVSSEIGTSGIEDLHVLSPVPGLIPTIVCFGA